MSKQTQAFESLRQELAGKVSAKEQERAEVSAQIEDLTQRLEEINVEGSQAFQALQAHEQTMRTLGILDGRKVTKKVVAKAAPKKTKKKTAKKAVSKKATAKKAKSKKTATKKAATKKAASKAKTATKKASPKKAKGGKAKTTNTSNAAEGRRAVARGDRPPMKEAMVTVMGGPGGKPFDAASIVEGLEKRGWMPQSKDPQQYISYMLSSNKDTFERIGRGQYTVRAGATKAAPKKTRLKKATEAKTTKAVPTNGEVDKELGDLGITEGNVAANPFTA